MDRKITLPILLAFAVGCGRHSSTMQRGQQQYDVVQEGTSTAATSTINGPGETPPPMGSAPTTNTAVDTTTNFTLPNATTTGGSTMPGTLAGTLPPPSTQTVYRQPARRTTTRTTETRQSNPQPPPAPTGTMTQTQTTQTTSTEPVPPTTDTTATRPPDNKKNKNNDQPQPAPPPPPTDTTATGTQGW